jgi:hypothetical protein
LTYIIRDIGILTKCMCRVEFMCREGMSGGSESPMRLKTDHAQNWQEARPSHETFDKKQQRPIMQESGRD